MTKINNINKLIFTIGVLIISSYLSLLILASLTGELYFEVSSATFFDVQGLLQFTAPGLVFGLCFGFIFFSGKRKLLTIFLAPLSGLIYMGAHQNSVRWWIRLTEGAASYGLSAFELIQVGFLSGVIGGAGLFCVISILLFKRFDLREFAKISLVAGLTGSIFLYIWIRSGSLDSREFKPVLVFAYAVWQVPVGFMLIEYMDKGRLSVTV